MKKTKITVQTIVKAHVNKAWMFWTTPKHITQWNFAADSWHSPTAENDLQVGGKFNYRMEAKDGSFGFDFWGIYDKIITQQRIIYTMGDGRKAEISFINKGNETTIVETFETETENTIELQQGGWQDILDNFKKYVEAN